MWPALLMLGFAPMLYRLRKQIGASHGDDGDQRVLVAFIAAIGSVRIEDAGKFAAVALRRAVERTLFAPRAVAVEDAPDTVTFDEAVHSPCNPFGLTEAEIHAEAALAARRAARIDAERAELRARVRTLPTRRHRAA